MTITDTSSNHARERKVALLLQGGLVTAEFRQALFFAASRAGMSIDAFVLRCAAEMLDRNGYPLPGVFSRGDLIGQNDNTSADTANKRTAKAK
jgi:hypothetical protein